MKVIRYTTALKAPMYLQIKEECVRRLERYGYFSKNRVLKETGYDIVEESVRWDHVIRMLEEQHDIELIGVIADFFKRHSDEGEPIQELIKSFPEKFVAGNAGQERTAGFVSVEPRNQGLVHVKLGLQNKSMQGMAGRITSITAHARRSGAIGIDPSCSPGSVEFPPDTKRIDRKDDAA